MRALILGGCGFVGSHTVEYFLSQGAEVQVIDNLYTKINNLLHLGDRVVIHKISILDPKVESIFINFAPDVVVHLAAIPEVQTSIDNPELTYRVNLLGTQRLLHYSSKYKVGKFVFASSAAIYGDYDVRLSGSEEDDDKTTIPISNYGLQKKLSEELITTSFNDTRLPYAILRYFNIYGPRQKMMGSYAPVMAKFKTVRSGGEHITVYNRGKQIRDFIHVKDVARANYLAAISDNIGIANIATGHATVIRDVASMFDDKPKFTDRKRPGDISFSLANVSRAKQLFDFTSQISFQSGVKDIL
jgi:UDP-glucose 4-epimerase